MQAQADRQVEINENGRSGAVLYREGADRLSFYWEFGGGEVVAIIQVNDAVWPPAWLAARQGEVLRFVADEVIRQKAPGCRAEIDPAKGVILLRGSMPSNKAPGPERAADTAWIFRYSALKMKLGLVLLVLTCIGAAFFWFKNKVMVIDPGSGTPFGSCVRTEAHIATLISTLVPYTPSLHRDHRKDRYRLSLFLLPLDGSAPKDIPITGELEGNSYSLCRVIGSDGRTLWLDATSLYGIDLASYDLIATEDLREANASIDPKWWEDTRRMDIVAGRLQILSDDHSQALSVEPGTLRAAQTAPVNANRLPFEPALTNYLAAGFYTSRGTWLGLLSPEEMESEFAPKRWVRPVEGADEAKMMRRFYRGTLDPASDNERHQILAMDPIGDAEMLNAAFLRMDEKSEPVRLTDPSGALMIHTSEPGLKGSLIVARVDTAGTILWKVDTGINRFKLQRILPGEGSMAFVGTRLPVPDKVSEPLLVIIDNNTGKATTHSLWR